MSGYHIVWHGSKQRNCLEEANPSKEQEIFLLERYILSFWRDTPCRKKLAFPSNLKDGVQEMKMRHRWLFWVVATTLFLTKKFEVFLKLISIDYYCTTLSLLKVYCCTISICTMSLEMI